MSHQQTSISWMMCNAQAHFWLYGGDGSGDPHDGLPCRCGRATWGEAKRKAEEAEAGRASYALRTKPLMHPALAWLLLTLMLVALVLAGVAQ